MSVVPTPNYKELIAFLKDAGIDADRVPEDSLSPEGYEYWPDPNSRENRLVVSSDGRLAGKKEFLAWPSEEFYENVVTLLSGGTLKKKAAKK